MRILRNQSIIDKLSSNLINNELSNIAAVLAVPQVLVTYYSIDAEYSQTVEGYQNIHDFISVDSTVAFNKVNNMPIAGIDNLLMTSEFNDETGMDVDFESAGMVLPKTVNPKQNDFFVIPNMLYPTVFVVTDVKQTIVRSNPFQEIHFKVAHQGQDWIDQLNRQVLKTYNVSVSSLGGDNTLLIEEGTAAGMEEHIQNYLDVSAMYTSFFYDHSRAAFVFDGLPSKRGSRICLIDIVLWKLMYELGIIVYDDIITYAASNYDKTIKKIYVDNPILVDDWTFKNSIIYRILENDHNKVLNEYQFPMFYEESAQITKYQGAHVIYIEGYSEKPWCHKDLGWLIPFDGETLCRMVNNEPYEEGETEGWSLKNALISYYNTGSVDFTSLEIENKKTLTNYYYIPIILGIYKDYIVGLQNGTVTSTDDSSSTDTSTTGTSTSTTTSSNSSSTITTSSSTLNATLQNVQTLYNAINGLSDSNAQVNHYNTPLGGIGT